MYPVQINILLVVVLFIGHASADCCPPGQVILRRKDECWDPTTGNRSALTLTCKNMRFQNPLGVDEDGSLIVKITEKIIDTISNNEFCLANATTMKDVYLENVTLQAIVCVDKEPLLDDRIIGYCLIVSVVFMFTTALIYMALPELRDVLGKSIINLCLCYAIGETLLAVIKISTSYTDMDLCAVRGFLAYFFLTAAFFWTNVIAVQVLLNTRRPAVLDYSWYEFKWYFSYGWVGPAVCTIILAIGNYYPGDHRKPDIGIVHCWFTNKYQQIYYMYSVMSVLVGINVLIFIYVAFFLWRQTFSSSHLMGLKFKFILTIRLITLMGLPLVFEVLLLFIEPDHIVYAIMDLFISLKGVLIFLLLVVFRRRVLKLMQRHGWLACAAGLVERHLADHDDEENVIQHTDVPFTMNDKPTVP